ncbi:MAG: hypothetical protein NUW21_13390, partial [Elusimicrobia bacterium]|nr:hypothetical protein [Elusimicrobiota bacterium]
MATPRYERRIRGAAMPTPSAAPAVANGMEQFGAGIEKAAQVAGGIANDVNARAKREAERFATAAASEAEAAKREAERFDTAAASEAEAAFQVEITKHLYDNKDGALHVQGAAAMPAVEAAQAALVKRRKEIGDALGTGAKEMYDSRTTALLDHVSRTGESYISAQSRVAEQASLEANIASSLGAIAVNHDDELEAASQVERLREQITKLSLSPEDAEVRLEAVRRKAVEIRLTRYIEDGDAAKAGSLFTRSEEMLGTRAAPFRRKVEAVAR